VLFCVKFKQHYDICSYLSTKLVESLVVTNTLVNQRSAQRALKYAFYSKGKEKGQKLPFSPLILYHMFLSL